MLLAVAAARQPYFQMIQVQLSFSLTLNVACLTWTLERRLLLSSFLSECGLQRNEKWKEVKGNDQMEVTEVNKQTNSETKPKAQSKSQHVIPSLPLQCPWHLWRNLPHSLHCKNQINQPGQRIKHNKQDNKRKPITSKQKKENQIQKTRKKLEKNRKKKKKKKKKTRKNN